MVKINNNEIHLKKRQEIYRHISKKPGLHERKISKDLDIPRSTLRYHLNFLEKRELISYQNKDKFKRYFISNKIGRYEKDVLSFLGQEVTRNIILYILYHRLASRKELSEEFEKSPSTISFHINKLLEKKIIKMAQIEGNIYIFGKKNTIVHRKKSKNEKVYTLVDPWKIWDVLIIYKDSNFEKITVDLIWETKKYHMNRAGKLPNKILRYEKAIDIMLDKLYDVFPHPYHI